MTVKLPGLDAKLAAFVTVMGPVVAPLGTTAVIVVSLTTVKPAAGMPLKNVTFVASVKPVPVMVTMSPIPPLGGAKPVTVGATITVKLVALVALPAPALTTIGPVVAPTGTVAVT